MKRIIALMLALLMVGAVMVGCSNKSESKADDKKDATEAATEAPTEAATEAAPVDATDDLAYVKEKGWLVVGVTDFAPMDSKNAEGMWVGFDADMAKEFAEYIGVGVEYVEIDWDNKVLELNNKNIDCVWNGMTLTDDVKAQMSTSVPYCNNAQVVVVKADVADKYKTAEDCKELNFAVESGSAGQEQADANDFLYTEVKDQATALMEVAAGTADAAIIDSLMAAAMVGAGTGYEQLTYTVKLNSEEYGVGFRKGSDITEKFNEFFKKATEDGTVDEIAELYGIQAALIK
ncbi:MAG: transporter substrate-binding domain-containing protein [Ruminococcus sp.]|nr:transporter substrate-binding domain-containing protein [Ruminococcus sp.]